MHPDDEFQSSRRQEEIAQEDPAKDEKIGAYTGRILATTQANLFTVANRETFTQKRASLAGQTLGEVICKFNWAPFPFIAGNPVTATFFVEGDITNYLSAGESLAWPAAEQDKAPADEVAEWAALVTHIQDHEQGHVTTQNGLPATVIQTQAGWTDTQVDAAAEAVQNSAHNAFHLTFEGNVDGECGHHTMPNRL